MQQEGLMTNKILCATDGTDHSLHAIQLAAQMAAKLGAKLSVCAVNVARGGARGPLIYTCLLYTSPSPRD